MTNSTETAEDVPLPKPPWIRTRLGRSDRCGEVRRIVKGQALHTVCEEALCPNQGRCWEHGRATIMILGGTCTRSCRFCGVGSVCPPPPDPDEPARVADAVRDMGLKDVVLTSVTRDDLPDGGASVWVETIKRTRAAVPGIMLEVLVPDFAGNESALATVIEAAPDVFGHNLETVPAMYDRVRPEADYGRSLSILGTVHRAGLIVKTSLMVGVGETDEQVRSTMRDAYEAGCDIIYIGQYLRPSKSHLAVARYVEPGVFDSYCEYGRELGFGVVVSAPLVRSSYHTEEQAAYVTERLAANSA